MRSGGRIPANADLIYCERTEEPASRAMKFLGFDYGYLDDDGCYSLLFNEIIWGRLEPLRIFARRLNEHLLFPDLSWASDYFYVRATQVALGKDLEHVDADFLTPSAVAIFEVPDRRNFL